MLVKETMSVITAQPRPSENYTLSPNEDVINEESNNTNLMEIQDASDDQKKKKEGRKINEEEVETCCCPALYWIAECTDCCVEFFADCIQQCCENSSPSGGDVSNDTSGCCDFGCGDEGCCDGGCGDTNGCCDSCDD